MAKVKIKVEIPKEVIDKTIKKAKQLACKLNKINSEKMMVVKEITDSVKYTV